VAFTQPSGSATRACLLGSIRGPGLLLRWLPLGHLRHFNFIAGVQAEAQTCWMHPSTMLGVTGVCGVGALFAAHGTRSRGVTSFPLGAGSPPETGIPSSTTVQFGPGRRDVHIVGGPRLRCRLIFQYASFKTTGAACTSCWPPGRWWASGSRPWRGQLLVSTSTRPQLQPSSVLDPPRPGDQHLVPIVRQPVGGLGSKAMHERNVHNFPLDLATKRSTPVALTHQRSLVGLCPRPVSIPRAAPTACSPRSLAWSPAR